MTIAYRMPTTHWEPSTALSCTLFNSPKRWAVITPHASLDERDAQAVLSRAGQVDSEPRVNPTLHVPPYIT